MATYILEEASQILLFDGFAKPSHQFEQKVDIVDRQQVAEVIVTFNSMQVSSSKITTSLALAVRFNTPKIFAVLLIAQFDLSVGGEGCAEAGSSSGIDAVEHIHT